jgi:glycine cleavage system H lipoate-binding protein/NAD-dependent dihydropyrimidine dehydrogenase PreA subunit
MITLTIDDRKVEVPEGSTVLEAAKKLGIWIPTLCHHEGLGSAQACRLCTVEEVREGGSRLQASCAMPATEGMKIRTDSERVVQGRKVIMELILARVPGVQAIRDLAARIGVTATPFSHKDDDCVLCGLCVRVCSEIMGVGAIGFTGRGVNKAVETPFGEAAETCRACGACTYVCPTGKMQMEAEQVEKFRRQQGWERQCRYQRMGFFSYKICSNDFQCWNCAVDQAMEERFGTHPALIARPGVEGEIEEIGEFRFSPLYHYHVGHMWVNALNGRIRVGLDDFAGRILTPLTDLKLPSLGDRVTQGEPVLTLRSRDRSAQFRFPVAGRIVDVNPVILEDPALPSTAPYSRGWIATVEPDNLRPDLMRLLHRHTARQWMHDEKERLYQFVSDGTQSVAADGGILLDNLPGQLTTPQWGQLVKEFFGT